MLEVKLFLNEMEGRLRGVRDGRMRRRKFADLLLRLSDEDACDVLEALYIDGVLHRPPGQLLIHNLAYLDDFLLWIGHDRLAAWHHLAGEAGYRFVADILAPPAGLYPELLPDGHKDLAHLSLGEKKSLAKRPDVILIEKLMMEPSPEVIANLLNNGRTTLRHVLYIATRRPNHPLILEMVFKHRTWSTMYEVRRALAGNPYTRPGVVLVTVPLLTEPDLKRLSYGVNVNATLVQSVLALRREERGEDPFYLMSDDYFSDVEHLASEELAARLADESTAVDEEELEKARVLR